MHKLLLAAHIIVSGGWLGVVVAKLALGLAAATAAEADVAVSLYAAVRVVDAVFPPAAIATIVTGVFLSLSTKWGPLDYFWVVAKIGLSVVVPLTAIRIGERLLREAAAAPVVSSVADGAVPGGWSAPTQLIVLSVAHVLMLGAATVISVYKPWGKTWLGRRKPERPMSSRQ